MKGTKEIWYNHWRHVKPKSYLIANPSRSLMLVEAVNALGLDNPSILEIGCNCGRNLEHLRQAGYTDLHGVEISQQAIDMMQAEHPELYDMATIHVSPIEEIIKTIGQYDVIYTMAVLMHIHDSSEWIFSYMAKACRKNLITIEKERGGAKNAKARHYGRVFHRRGFAEIRTVEVSHKIIAPGHGAHYIMRVFEK